MRFANRVADDTHGLGKNKGAGMFINNVGAVGTERGVGRLPVSRHPDLPAGIMPADCEGKFDPLCDAGAEELWRACDDRQQVRIAEAFTRQREDDVRDALLEAGEFSAQSQASAVVVGRAIWRSWVEFRDRSVDRLHHRGLLSGETSGPRSAG